jgi:hypothetical protein
MESPQLNVLKAGFLQEARMAAFSDKIPQLPDEAFTRESFYRDHD